jgi:4-diphosphocytidyl-2-C-methyl-D-erythritol kinase
MLNPGRILTVFAPAKVNLHLAVKERRPDGFHNLESIFAAIDFGDTLRFEPVPVENYLDIAMEGLNLTLPAEENVIFKAFSLFKHETGYNQGLKIQVEKRIPVGGGLGGGSSDAAATLNALNMLSGNLLNRNTLLEMAASLGSDVPFFLYETGAAWVSGRGEQITPIEAPRGFMVLVNPGFPSETAAAFRLLDDYRARSSVTKDFQKTVFLYSAALRGNPADWPFSNDFLPAFPEREQSVYNQIITRMKEQGADFAGLSGAGSTCFAFFSVREQAEKAEVALSKLWNFVKFVIPIEKNALLVRF